MRTGGTDMAKQSRQKLKLLYIREYLRRNTDEDHPVSVNRLIEYLAKNDIPCERKTIYDDIQQLIEYGDDIVLIKKKNGGYYCASTEFETSEIKLLVDSIQSSKFIPEKQSLELISKLEGLTNKYEASQLQRQVVVQNRVKSMSESVFNGVDHISYAINNDVTIRFRYFQFNLHKKPEYRHDGKFYEVSPLTLIWDNENYYLLAFDAEAGIVKNFRVDKMNNIRYTENKRQGVELFGKADLTAYSKQVFGMFNGKEETVRIRFANNLIGVVVDRFGKDIGVVPDGDEHFIINTKIKVSPQFYAWLFGFADECEVLSPESVRKEYNAKLKATLKLYK